MEMNTNINRNGQMFQYIDGHRYSHEEILKSKEILKAARILHKRDMEKDAAMKRIAELKSQIADANRRLAEFEAGKSKSK
jgi:hypothetical protein